MKLIKNLGLKLNKDNHNIRYGLFYCNYCNREVEKPYYGGLKYKSCGCSMYQISSKSLTIHGDCKRNIKNKNGNRKANRLYYIYNGMKSRCYNKEDKKYKNYGGRGIKVCNMWNNFYIMFKIWALLHGYKDNLSIDRIDNNGNYKSSNCKWATQAQQVQNSSKAKLNWNLVKKIRKLFNHGFSRKRLSELFNISKSQIEKIIRNECWKEEVI